MNDSRMPGISPVETTEVQDTATFGGGCFWCTEAVFSELKGVISVTSGYSGGKVDNPTYEQVCTGMTGHAEVIQVVFDPSMISFTRLLEVFWSSHDPTTLNRQGADVGTQYRSVIFYHSHEQQEIAESYRQKLNDSGVFYNPVVTEITAFNKFYPAEAYHHEYFARNPNAPYCRVVIQPKVEKMKKLFREELK